MTEDRIADAARIAQCAYYISGTAPEIGRAHV
jgi:hypothetical protein